MRVLIVEDEARIAAEIAEVLQRAGFAVSISGDGEDAWFRAGTEDFDAIILDLGLPKLDGLSVLRSLRQGGVGTPIIILTARGAWMERVEGIDAGADDYLSKPFHGEELVARLGAVLRRGTNHHSAIINAGPIRIDTRGLTVTINGTIADLTSLEFRLLRYLVHHKGRVLSQIEIEEHVYANEQEPESNAVEALVRRVRRKIGNDRILTRRGHGYVVQE